MEQRVQKHFLKFSEALHSCTLFSFRVPSWQLPLFTANCSCKLCRCINAPTSMRRVSPAGKCSRA